MCVIMDGMGIQKLQLWEHWVAYMQWRLSNMPYARRLSRISSGITIIFAMLLLLTSCKETDKQITITAKNMFDGTYASIDVMGYDVLPGSLESTGYVTFKSSKDLDSMFDILKDNEEFSVVKYSDSLFFEFPMGDYTNYYCLSKAGTRYLFGSLQCNVIVDVSNDTSRRTEQILLPIHLFTDELILNGERPYYTLYMNADYKTSGSIDDFLSFYQNCKWYNVQKHDGLIIVEAALDTNGTKKESFAIRFTEKDGQMYFAILYE